MKLLQLSSLRFLVYTLLLVLTGIPVSYIIVKTILNRRTDNALRLHRDEFISHIKRFESFDDLERDLIVVDQLNYDVDILPDNHAPRKDVFETVSHYDSIDRDYQSVRELTCSVLVKNIPYRLTLRIPLIASEELAFTIGLAEALMITLLALGLVLINTSLSAHIWQPFYKTLAKLKEFDVDKNKTFTVESTHIVEFDALNKAIQHLTQKNKQIFLQQKEFIENAAHELQSPLAIFQSKLDLLAQQPGLTEHQATVIDDLNSTTQRMAWLNKNLLLLTKIENKQFEEHDIIELKSLINQQINNQTPYIALQKTDIQISLEETTLHGNRTILEILFNNLFTNAVKHYEGGHINVTLENRTLTVANQGASSLPEDKIFDRFYKQGNNTNSLGLGLAIVKKICEVCGYPISYRFDKGYHEFQVRFPAPKQ